MAVKPQLIILFISFLSILKGQSIDSLLVLANGYGSDTLRAELFYKNGFQNRLKNPNFSYQCARYCEAYASQSYSGFHKAKAATLLGILYYRKGDYKKALAYHEEALYLRRQINDLSGIAKSQLNLANIYVDLQQFKQAELAYIQALQVATETNDSLLSSKLFLNLGVLHQQNTANYKLSEYYYLKALERAKQNNDYELQGSAYNNLSDLSIATNSFDKAEIYAEASLTIKDLMDNEPEKVDSYLNLAKVYLELKNNQLAQSNLAKAEAGIQQFDYTEALPEFYKLNARLLEATGHFEAATSAYKHLLSWQDKMALQKTAFTFNEDFSAHVEPIAQKSNIYLIWIFLFLLIPLAAYLIKPKNL